MPMDQTCKDTSFNDIDANETIAQDDMELSTNSSHENDPKKDESFTPVIYCNVID